MVDTVMVIGGGVAGLSVARNLQLLGRKVAIVDPLPSPGAASFGNGGFISPDSFMPGAQPGMLRKVPGWLRDPLGPLTIHPAYAPQALPWFIQWLRAGQIDRMTTLAKSLHALHAPALIEWRRLLGDELYCRYIREDGEAILSDVPPQGSAADVERQLTERYGLNVETLSRADIERLYPGIDAAVRFGVLKKGNAHTVSPAELNRALAERIVEHGGTFHREKVLKLIPKNGEWLILTSTGNHRARDVVVAGGVWSMQLLAPLGIRIPLESQRGYHVMVDTERVKIGVPFIHRGRAIGLTPMLDGLRIAGSVEFGGVDGMPNEQRALHALQQARELFPALIEAPHRIWTGQRPSTPDSLPAIGAAGEQPGLWLCFGHGTYGMTAAPPSGRMLADLITSRQPSIDPAPYSPRRFH
ncbi:FAD-binding oxidoreductase [Caballeronia sp. LZ032]|uniref:NAD(P)/FAD-dependent oxidoreductase n=1 Tax=Caballeronia sp. LZ032 TaxID=3038565 RepID=UPI00285BA545|nr:FAD-binding oxidoreductase [Caballeronia sp. LZ032]MDR5878664.1 FAD-binding oxidoreductase [Caballeronia sp. LZ032]